MTRSIGEFLGAYKAPRLTVRLTTRSDLLAELARVADQYEQLGSEGGMNVSPERQALIDRQQELVEEIQASEFEFEFEGLPQAEYHRLMASCPPKPSDAKKGAQFDMESFSVALISACAVEPKMTPDEVRQLMDVITDSQITKLVQVAFAVNIGEDTTPKFATRSRQADPVEMSSASPTSEESPAPSSSDE